MNRDRAILWAFIIGLALLIMLQIVGNVMLNQRQKQDEPRSQPNPKSFDLFAH